MLVLALDTTSEKGGAAIYRDENCLALVANEGPANAYSLSLFKLVARALELAKLRPSSPAPQAGEDGAPPRSADRSECAPLAGLGAVELFAVANGPGSFTGIRVGIAAVQAWAKAFGRPVRGVSVLEAMVRAAGPDTEWAVPILDARRGEFFLGCFRRSAQRGPAGEKAQSQPQVHKMQAIGCGQAFEPEGEGWVLKPHELNTFLQERLRTAASVTCLAREHDRAALALREALPERYIWQSLPGTLLEAIARLGMEAHARGSAQEPAELHACYIRRPDAELNWRE